MSEQYRDLRTSRDIPPAPPPPPPKKRRVWPWVVGTIIVIAAINGANQGNETTTPEPFDVSSLEEPDITSNPDFQIGAARLAWDTAITQAERNDICDYYNTPPVGVTSELVEAFAEGAEMPYDDAERVLDQLLAEKC